MAGDSADEVARRAREKADRLLRRAEMFEKGAEGERIVADLLAQLPPTWFVLNDIHWPGRQWANIDHVVVGPAGVFVIDAKNWSGRVVVSKGVLRQNGYNRAQAIDGALAASSSVAGLLRAVDPHLVFPVLCFVGEGHVDGQVGGVRMCGAASLLSMLQGQPVRLSVEMLQFLRFDLDMSARSASETYRPVPSPSSRAAMSPHRGLPLPPPDWGPTTSIPMSRHRAERSPKVRVILTGVGLWFVVCMLLGMIFDALGMR